MCDAAPLALPVAGPTDPVVPFVVLRDHPPLGLHRNDLVDVTPTQVGAWAVSPAELAALIQADVILPVHQARRERLTGLTVPRLRLDSPPCASTPPTVPEQPAPPG